MTLGRKRDTSAASNSSADPDVPTNAASTDFDWFKLTPSATLQWVSCYEEPFQCARLEVPLDYANPDGEKAAVALLKYPSRYPSNNELYRGPILYNPGGPGGSGVDRVHDLGATVAAIIGDDFDHIGFDPRGIGRTTPIMDAMPTDAERMTWSLTQTLSGVNSTQDAMGKVYGQAKILGNLVEQRQKTIAQHMSTATVARDMLSITKAHGRDKLQYWGFSYGTVLGATYAAMFPDNVGRVILDGVLDAENYYSAAWDNNLRDTDKALQMILDQCVASSACPLRESSSKLVAARIDAILDGLKTAPLTVQNGSLYGTVEHGLTRRLVFFSLYDPINQYPPLFSALAAAEKGDGAPLYALLGRTESTWRGPCDADGQIPAPDDAVAAVACGDADPLNEDLAGMKQHYAKMAEMSSFAEYWNIHSYCTGWNIRPVERFHSPFIGNTSYPLLFIGNVADPVAPLWNAEKMSKGFTGSVVLTQNNPGHCSVSAPSLCTAGHVRAYFRDGSLPTPGTVCDVEQGVFPADGDKMIRALVAFDRQLLDASRDLSARFKVPALGLSGMRNAV
ncbi:alpha/beta-hydrolase [Auricularia subglabra TFB-10046 SS5]|nr:alpha/beta-hydrolase [Auricularia subglabra TFB-10046 SS5]